MENETTKSYYDSCKQLYKSRNMLRIQSIARECFDLQKPCFVCDLPGASSDLTTAERSKTPIQQFEDNSKQALQTKHLLGKYTKLENELKDGDEKHAAYDLNLTKILKSEVHCILSQVETLMQNTSLKHTKDKYLELKGRATNAIIWAYKIELDYTLIRASCLNDKLLDVDERIYTARFTSYDGQLTVIISDYEDAKERAMYGESLRFPFYTSEYGYKMCLRVFLNGSGDAVDKCLSLYLCVEKGEYDDTLSWPMQQEISIEVVNQIDPMSGELTVFKKEDIRISRPGEGEIRGRGLEQMINHETLEYDRNGFLVDDSIVIQVKVYDPEEERRAWKALMDYY